MNNLEHNQSASHATPALLTYAIGYFLSLALTFGIFGITYVHIQSGHILMSHELLHFWIVVFALLQCVLQAVFFLHLSGKPGARLNLLSFLFTVYSVVFIVIGSLWIMNNLQYNMTADEISRYMHMQN